MTSTIQSDETNENIIINKAINQYKKHLYDVSSYQKNNKEKISIKNRRNYMRIKEDNPEKYKAMLEMKKIKYQQRKELKQNSPNILEL